MRGRSALVALAVAALFVPRAALAQDDEVRVHVDGDPQVVLERRIPDIDLWESVCRAPCDEKLPAEGSYRVTGHGIRPSAPLPLDPVGPNVTLAVKASYSAGYYGSLTLAIIGPIMMVAGAFTTIVGAANHSTNVEDPCAPQVPCATSTPPQSNAVTITGVGLIGTGVAMMVAGIFGMTTSNRTIVRRVGALTISPTGVAVRF